MNKDLPLVSVITATYKRFDHLYQTIGSMLSQTYDRLEYVITDDGSDPFPAEEINRYIEEHNTREIPVQIIHHEQNVGTVKNLNNAYRKARGDILINLSAGDVFFSPDTVAKIAERFAETQKDVIVTSRILYSGDFQPVCLLPHYEERALIQAFETGTDQYKAFITSRFYDMASGSAMAFSRKILEQMNYYDERYVLWEDGPFLAKYLQIGKLECAYDIVSIWYEAGGVSDKKAAPKGKSTKQDKLYLDNVFFNEGERIEHLNWFSFSDRRWIRYRNKRYYYRDSRIRRYLLYLTYFPEVISGLIYSRKREARKETDSIEIDRLMKEKRENASG